MAANPAQAGADPEFRFSAVLDAIRLLWPQMFTWILGAILLICFEEAPKWIAPVQITRRIPNSSTYVSIDPSLSAVLASLAVGLLLSIPSGLIAVGIQRVALQLTRGEKASIPRAFQLKGTWATLALAYFVFTLVQGLVITPLYWILRHRFVPPGSTNGWQFYFPWMVAATVLGAVLFTPVLLSPLLIAEKRLSFVVAVKCSWQATRTWLPRLLGAMLLITIIQYSGQLAGYCWVFAKGGGALLLAAAGIILMFATAGIVFTFPAVVYAQLIDGADQDSTVPI